MNKTTAETTHTALPNKPRAWASLIGAEKEIHRLRKSNYELVEALRYLADTCLVNYGQDAKRSTSVLNKALLTAKAALAKAGVQC